MFYFVKKEKKNSEKVFWIITVNSYIYFIYLFNIFI